MNPDHDERDEEYAEDEAPRSIFSTAWFRAILVVLVLGIVGAIAVPYVLDTVNAPPTTTARAPSPPGPEGAGARAVTTPAEPAKPPSPTLTPRAIPPTPATAKPAVPAPPAATAKPVEAAKPAERVKTPEPAKAAERTKVAEPAKPAESTKVAAATKPAAVPGDFFVQVGAFKDEAIAKRVAARLRESNYPVTESVKRVSSAPVEPSKPAASRTAAATPGDRYDVIVSGGTSADINTKLSMKGLASEPEGDRVRIRPSLPLRDAVALSKDLGNEGFKVQVRRGGGSEPVTSMASAGTDTGTLFRVRVGGYADRTAALTAQRELREKGYDGFITKGRD